VSADQYLKQEPRSSAFFRSDASAAADAANNMALEHAGKDHRRYVEFLRSVASDLNAWADETEATLPKEEK